MESAFLGGWGSVMRMLLSTLGSRGDVEPFVWLARAAQEAGHEVRVALPRSEDVGTAGVDAVGLGISFADLAETLGGGAGAALRSYRERIRPAMVRALAQAVDLAVDWRPQVILAHPKVLTAPVAAAKLGVPWLVAELTPTLTPTREFPAAGVAARSLGPWLNRLSYRAVGLAGAMFGSEVTQAQRRHGVSGPLPPPAATLAAFSPTLVPRPKDWPVTTQQTGDWHGPAGGGALEPSLAAFLDDPRPFLYAGFGSMTGGDAVGRARVIVAGARAVGHRVLFVTGWGGLDPSSDVHADDVYVTATVPLAAVLPRAAAAMHHGGAGTVHAATRAGTPSIVVPFLGDQPFWAAQLQRIGLAGPPLDNNRLDPPGVTAAVRAAIGHADPVRQAADRMQSENGTEAAITHLTRST